MIVEMIVEPITLGTISDTHGQLRSEAIEALRGSDRILHAGDVGAPEILEALSQIAPVAAIRGNIDTGPWARLLPDTEVVEVGGVSIYMLHDINKLDLNPEAAGFRVVIYGHSQIAGQRRKVDGRVGKSTSPILGVKGVTGENKKAGSKADLFLLPTSVPNLSRTKFSAQHIVTPYYGFLGAIASFAAFATRNFTTVFALI
jgi:putative phosphoesterase